MKKGGKITPVCCVISSWHMCMKKEEGGKNRKNKGSEKIPEKASNEVVPNKRKIEGVVPSEKNVFWYMLLPFHSYG